MVTGAVAGNISPEATSPPGNIFTEAMRGGKFGHLPPSQIVPRLANQQRYVGSESTFYRVLRAENQLAHRRSERVAHKRSKPRAVCATEPDQLFSWDITYLPTTVAR